MSSAVPNGPAGRLGAAARGAPLETREAARAMPAAESAATARISASRPIRGGRLDAGAVANVVSMTSMVESARVVTEGQMSRIRLRELASRGVPTPGAHQRRSERTTSVPETVSPSVPRRLRIVTVIR